MVAEEEAKKRDLSLLDSFGKLIWKRYNMEAMPPTVRTNHSIRIIVAFLTHAGCEKKCINKFEESNRNEFNCYKHSV